MEAKAEQRRRAKEGRSKIKENVSDERKERERRERKRECHSFPEADTLVVVCFVRA